MSKQHAHVALLLSDLNGGGAERMVLNVASWLWNQNRFRVTLLCLRKRGELLHRVPEGLPVVELGRTSALSALPALVHWLKENNTDLLYTTQLQTNVTASLAARWVPNLKVVLREANSPLLHHAWGSDPNATLIKRLKRQGLSIVAGPLYRRADGWVAVSGGVATEMSIVYNLPEEKVRVIWNPVLDEETPTRMAETPAWSPPAMWGEAWKQEWERRIGDPDHRSGKQKLLVSVGRISHQKGHDRLIDALERLQEGKNTGSEVGQKEGLDLRLLLIGSESRDPVWVHSLKRMIERNGLQERVAFAGHLQNPLSIVRRSDLFLLPSRREGLPSALIEALACGVPVISADCPHGPSEILDGGKFGRLLSPDSSDPDVWAPAIRNELTSATSTRTARMERARCWTREERCAELSAYVEEVLYGRGRKP